MAAIFLIVTVLCTKFASAVAVFDASDTHLKHMVLDPNTGHLVVGAVNKLFRLSSELTLLETVTTGPKLDHPKCTAFNVTLQRCTSGVDDGDELRETDNYNKLLVLDTENNRILTCGTVYQGVCEFRSLTNLSDSTTYYNNKNEHTLAPNVADDKFSAVGFIAPGPTCDGSSPYVGPSLYIGQSNTNSQKPSSDIRDDIPAYSSHRLHDGVLDDIYSNFFKNLGTYKTLEASKYLEEEAHVIQYISGFSHGGYSYFFTVELDSSSVYVTKLVRICQEDCLYKSYVEIVVSCESENTVFNLVQASKVVTPGAKLAGELGVETSEKILVTTFSNSSNTQSDKPDDYGAVCIFTFEELSTSFMNNIKNCYSGNGHTVGKFYTHDNTECPQLHDVEVTESFCYEDEDGTDSLSVAGEVPLQRPAALVSSSRLTAVEVDVVEGSTVAFLGTHNGRLKKVELKSHVVGREYKDDVVQAGAQILADIAINKDRTHLFIMTSNKIHRVPLVPGNNSDCSVASSCSECTALTDPYCGWCSLEKKCSQRSQCQNYAQPKRWLSYEAWCLKLNRVTPGSASTAKPTSIMLNIGEIAPLGADSQYQCVFGEEQYTQPATLQGSDITCLTPQTPPPIPDGQDSTHLTLYIYSTQTEVNFIQTEFDFYNCQVHTDCSSCASAAWNCRWCLYDNRCLDSSSQCQHEDKTMVREPDKCPSILPGTEFLIPVNVDKEILLRGRELPEPVSEEMGYQCVFSIEEERVAVSAERPDDTTVRCLPHQYSYSQALGEISPAVEIVWNGNFLLETKSRINVTLYKCGVLGQDCSQCLGLDNTHSDYKCRYCSGRCTYGDVCTAPVDTSCPPPVITSVSPLSGPVDGGTVITLLGENLGTKYSDVAGAVQIGPYSCTVNEEKYEVSTKIECRIGKVPNGQPQNLTVQLSLKRGGDIIVESYPIAFQYKNPELTGFSPEYGPSDGGTRVTVRGRHLQTGNLDNIVVTFGETRCVVQESVQDNSLTCETRPCSGCRGGEQQEVSVSFDEAFRDLNTRYTFTENPVISDIQPTRVFLAGGRHITVKGDHLNVVQKPSIYLSNRNYSGNCTASETGTQMICDSPQIKAPSPGSRVKRETAGSYQVGFEMDGVSSVQVEHLEASFNVSSKFEVVPDPEYDVFENGKRVFKPDTQLLLNGKNLSLACTVSEVSVHIGEEECVVRTLDLENLYCDPPKEQPSGTSPGELPQVLVRVGHIERILGELEYAVDSETKNGVWIIGVAVGGGFLLTLIIVILVIYVRKSTHADRQYKKLKMQLDMLESNVRNECKQAFAELQTEVSDFTSDISVIGIPVWDYKTYTFKVLFPSHTDHPVLHNGPEYMTNKFGGYDQGLHQFSQLLNSKHFMLIFIRTLEQQKNFSIRDKAVVASLLMIVLQDKMEYATEILKALMNELIDKSVDKKHPKLMLRRTESVVEKLLTNWLSICMYSYLKKHTGKELFMLYQAITRQTEKGPVDAIHAEARYSLSEDRLLREKIEPKILNINLVTDGEREPVTCRCLDCDTVTQAKQKALDAIYLNTPFSSRPSVYDVDLEWRSGKSGHLPLQDEDVTTEVASGWKKVNTLAHYHVPDGAVMALVQKRTKSEGVRMVHGRIEITAGSNSTIAPIVTVEEGQKVWHLVKHDDGLYVSRNQKVISEIFLTRLLATKGTLQQYIDELFLAILRVDANLPPAIKWLFDFLDTAAKRHNIFDPDVVHTWKSNSLPLRFWVNIIKNPEFVFDIHKSHITDSCLSVIAQTFMDSCSTMEHRLGKDSPSNKLLFAKDIPRYRSMVSKFYKGIQEQPPVSDQDMNQIMTEMSLNFLLKHYTADFNVSIALKELFKYAHQYNFELLEALDEDPSARKFHLANKFEEVTANLEGSNY